MKPNQEEKYKVVGLHLYPEPVRCCLGKGLVWKGQGSPSGHGYPLETERWYDADPQPRRLSACFPPIAFLGIQ